MRSGQTSSDKTHCNFKSANDEPISKSGSWKLSFEALLILETTEINLMGTFSHVKL